MTTNTKPDVKQQYEIDIQLIQKVPDDEQVKQYQAKVDELLMIINKLSNALASANEHKKNAYNARMTIEIQICQTPFNLDTTLTKEEAEKITLLNELRQKYNAASYTVSTIQDIQSRFKKILKMLKELNVKECPMSQKYVIADWTVRLFNEELSPNDYYDLSKHIHGSPNPYMQALSIALVTLVNLLLFATIITCIVLGLSLAVALASHICLLFTATFGSLYCFQTFLNDGMANEVAEMGGRFRFFKPEYVQHNTSSTITQSMEDAIPAQVIR
jgi:hypothetical protein